MVLERGGWTANLFEVLPNCNQLKVALEISAWRLTSAAAASHTHLRLHRHVKVLQFYIAHAHRIP